MDNTGEAEGVAMLAEKPRDPVTTGGAPSAGEDRRFAAGLAMRLAWLLWLERLARVFVISLVGLGAVFLVLALGAVIPHWPLHPFLAPYTRVLPWLLAGLPLLLSLVGTPGPRRAARIMDARAATADRLATALRFSSSCGETAPDPWRIATLRECHRYLSQVNFTRQLRFPLAGRLVGAGLALLALGGWLYTQGPREERLTPGETAALSAEQERQRELAQKLEELAKKLGGAPDQASRDIAAKLDKTARELAAQKAPKAEDLRAAALRQLAALEAATRAELDRRSQSFQLDQKDTKALAEALKASPEFAKAGQSLAESKTSQAAAQIKDTLSRLNEQAGKDAVDAVAAALSRQDPRTRPDAKKQPDSAAQKAMQALASQQTPEALKALRELAQMLEEMGGLQPGQRGDAQGQGMQSGQMMSKQSMAKLLEALQNLKDQARGGENKPILWPSGGGDDMEGDQEMVFMSGNNPGNQPGDSTAFMTAPLASPDSSEGMDSGTAEPLGEKPFDAGHINKSEGLRLNGLLGEGESLLTLTPSAAPGTKAATRYQEVYNAAEPAMQEALNREDIPLGSRELIRRYFDGIRP